MDISLLRERRTPSELTVTELNNYLKNLIGNDRLLNAISVRGEISNLTNHRSGHLYFTIKDEGSKIPAVMFQSSASGLRFVPENGMKVIVRCSVNVYVPSGVYQLYVSSMQPDGIGDLYLAYEQLKNKLEKEGLFSPEYKKKIPKIPKKVGVITSPTGAAIRDIINISGRRFPLSSIYVYPSLVQGDYAEDNLIRALDYFDKNRLVDVIIIGRGGGSIEDLWAFNGERLARKIFECSIPVISAVGHETDFTICDFVSDLRAPTPSAAAELAFPDKNDMLLKLDAVIDKLADVLNRRIDHLENRYLSIIESEVLTKPESIFDKKWECILSLFERGQDAAHHSIELEQTKLKVIAGKIDSLSPLAVLSRGYSVAQKNGGTLKSVDQVIEDDEIVIKIYDGDILAKVIEKRKNNG